MQNPTNLVLTGKRIFEQPKWAENLVHRCFGTSDPAHPIVWTCVISRRMFRNLPKQVKIINNCETPQNLFCWVLQHAGFVSGCMSTYEAE